MRWCIVLGVLMIGGAVGQNCRGDEQRLRNCEKLCDENNNCTIRAALLLPANTTYDASLAVVRPVVELALQSQFMKEVFPSWLKFEWQAYDVTDCDAAYAVISAIDAYNDCAHVFFGPACDFALASVARITKFLGSTGTPIISTGGFTFDFVQRKQSCTDEFYMLVRAGSLGFKDVAYFIISLMRKFEWGRAALLYETPAFENIVGATGGFLLASTIHQYMIMEGFHIFGWELQSQLTFEQQLLQHVGNDYASKLFEIERYKLLH